MVIQPLSHHKVFSGLNAAMEGYKNLEGKKMYKLYYFISTKEVETRLIQYSPGIKCLTSSMKKKHYKEYKKEQ